MAKFALVVASTASGFKIMPFFVVKTNMDIKNAPLLEGVGHGLRKPQKLCVRNLYMAASKKGNP